MAATYDADKINFNTFSNIINGQVRWTVATRHGVNPSTLEALPSSPVSTSANVEDAVKAARISFQSWRDTSVELRKEKIKQLAAALLAHKDEFARLLTTEQGKPICAPY
jgi:acyl-CoA reductase-like NAD-dependent aldehyde dehydrogenase